MRMTRGKGIADDTGSVNMVARIQEVTECLAYNTYHPVRHAMLEANIHHSLIPPKVNINSPRDMSSSYSCTI